MPEPVKGGVTETPEDDPDVSIELSDGELRWLRNQQRKQAGQPSKYVPHQGAKEKARRLRRRAT